MKEIVYNGVTLFGYYVYSDGRIFSSKTNKFIKPRVHEGGYLMTTLWNPKQKEIYIHRAVAFMFVDNPMNKKYVNHIDGDKHNNNSSNLEFVTAKENIVHAVKTGLANGCKRKLNFNIAEEIRSKRPSMSISSLAKEYNVSARTISFVVNGKHWKTNHK